MATKTFIEQIDDIKRKIELQYQYEFTELYRRIGNDFLSILKSGGKIDFRDLVLNYKPDYIAIFRKIFAEVNRKLGYGLRKQFNFTETNKLEIKSLDGGMYLEQQEQDNINKEYNFEMTLLLNNYTEKLAGDKFIDSETKWIQKQYEKASDGIEKFIEKQKQDIQKTEQQLLILGGIAILNKVQASRKKNLEKQLETIKEQLKEYEDNREQKINQNFARDFSSKIEARANTNTEFVVGKASAEIRELEYKIITKSNASIIDASKKPIKPFIEGNIVKTDIVSIATTEMAVETNTIKSFIKNTIEKIWRNKSQFIPKAKPRMNHVYLDEEEASEEGTWFVGGIEVDKPRDEKLPVDETANCRCEIEYKIKS